MNFPADYTPVPGRYSPGERDAFFDRIAEYPDAADGSNGQVPVVRNGEIGWENQSGSGGVTSFNGRTGAVVPEAGDYKTPYRPVTLPAANWTNSAQTVAVPGVSATETDQLIQPVPASASRAEYQECGVQATAQAANSLTFSCTSVPASDLTVYVCMTELEAAT